MGHSPKSFALRDVSAAWRSGWQHELLEFLGPEQWQWQAFWASRRSRSWLYDLRHRKEGRGREEGVLCSGQMVTLYVGLSSIGWHLGHMSFKSTHCSLKK